MTPFLVILFTLTVIAGKAVFDWFLIVKQKKSPKHGFELAIVAVLFFMIQATVIRRIYQWELAVNILLFQVTSFWLLFDGTLSVLRGLNWWYIGETSATDRWFKRAGIGPYFMTKLFALILCTYSVIWIYRLWN